MALGISSGCATGLPAAVQTLEHTAFLLYLVGLAPWMLSMQARTCH